MAPHGQRVEPTRTKGSDLIHSNGAVFKPKWGGQRKHAALSDSVPFRTCRPFIGAPAPPSIFGGRVAPRLLGPRTSPKSTCFCACSGLVAATFSQRGGSPFPQFAAPPPPCRISPPLFFGPPFFTFLLPLSSLLPCFLFQVKILIRSKVMAEKL